MYFFFKQIYIKNTMCPSFCGHNGVKVTIFEIINPCFTYIIKKIFNLNLTSS